MRRTALPYALLVLLLSGCGEGAGDLVLDAQGVAALSILNEDGPVTLTGASTQEITVLWTGLSDEGAADPADVEVTAEVSGTTAQVRAVTSGPDVWVDLDVAAPGDLVWSVTSGAGDVVLEELTGGGSVDTTTGNVSGLGLLGDLTVEVDLAEVDLAPGIAGGETITVTVGSGPITVRLLSSADVLLEASTGDGEVVIQEVPFTGTNAAGVASGELGAGATATMSLVTGAGDIRVVGSE